MQRRHFLDRLACTLAGGGLALSTAPALAADEGLGANHVTFGSSLALTGPLGGAGSDNTAGILAAFKAANATGGVNGRELRLITLDDAYVPERTVDNVKKLLDRNAAFALISTMGTANTAKVLPLVEAAGVPLVGPVTGAASLRQPQLKQVFFVRASYRDEAVRLVDQIVTMGLKDIAIVYLDNPYGQEVLRDAQATLQARGVKAVGSFALAVDGSNAKDVARQVAEARPGAVVLGTTGTANTAVMLALRAQSGVLPLAGLSVSVISSELAKLGKAAQGMAMVQVFPDADKPKIAAVRAYQAAMKAAGEEARIGGSSFEGWVNAQVMIEGLRRAGRDLTRDKLRQALASARRIDLGDYSLGFSGAGPFVASRFVELAVLGADGRRS
ncbi:ABC transporter substrate-binding protein [Aquabacterium sp.]|uniref:ABC transporter substrate-binding protein n=1 Tax=Aquabacterium sp. TaxID=1872578 RepID=UPI003783E969